MFDRLLIRVTCLMALTFFAVGIYTLVNICMDSEFILLGVQSIDVKMDDLLKDMRGTNI